LHTPSPGYEHTTLRRITNMSECPSCHRQVSLSNEDAPPQADTEAWRRLSEEHAPDCEWVRTHAPATQARAADIAAGLGDEAGEHAGADAQNNRNLSGSGTGGGSGRPNA
jgi:hypothetical protein